MTNLTNINLETLNLKNLQTLAERSGVGVNDFNLSVRILRAHLGCGDGRREGE